MRSSSIQLVYLHIRYYLQWSWILFIFISLVLAAVFFRVLYTNLQDKAKAWIYLFEQRLAQTETLLGDGSRFALPLAVTNMNFDSSGTILEAYPERLINLNISISGFFQHVKKLKEGQIHVLFHSDIVDGKQRVYFVKRKPDCFLAATFEAEDFFPRTATTRVSLALESHGVLLYSSIPQWIGELARTSILFWRSGRIYLSSATILKKTGKMKFYIIQDISSESYLALIVAVSFLILFWQINLRTRRIRHELLTLNNEQAGMSNLIQGLSRVSGLKEQKISEQLGRLICSFSESLHSAQAMNLKFAENRQYLDVLKRFMEDILSLLQKAGGNAQSLQHAHDELEERVRTRTAQLQAAKEAAVQARSAAEAANHAKSDFLAKMSHELRTPLNAILGFSQIMRRDADLSDQSREHLLTINRSGEHLLALINSILKISKIETGHEKLNNDSFNIRQLLHELEEMFCLRANAKDIFLSIVCADNVPEYIVSDQGKLRQILINLLGNAIKFTQQGQIELKLKARDALTHDQPPVQTNLFFQIKDTGPGIAEQDHEQIFQVFEQAGKYRFSCEGSGLGLAISREYSRLLGGDITLESRLGHGSVFCLKFPATKGTAETQSEKKSYSTVIRLETRIRPPKILVADDIKTNRELIVQMIKPVGFLTRQAVNGKQAISIYRDWRPDLILMDRVMPVMDGLEATRRIRAAPANQYTPIVFVSAGIFEKDRGGILICGGDDFIAKPICEEILFACLKKHLNLEYIYRNEAIESFQKAQLGKPKTESAPAGNLNLLPAKLLDTLKDRVRIGHARGIKDVIEQIAVHDNHIALSLSNLVDQFNYQAILELLEIDSANTQTAIQEK
ncbi:MAG: response regulator [Desulfobacteraceae bacterium]|nr:response regulator [Desulfobacteraceae bacterium]